MITFGCATLERPFTKPLHLEDQRDRVKRYLDGVDGFSETKDLFVPYILSSREYYLFHMYPIDTKDETRTAAMREELAFFKDLESKFRTEEAGLNAPIVKVQSEYFQKLREFAKMHFPEESVSQCKLSHDNRWDLPKDVPALLDDIQLCFREIRKKQIQKFDEGVCKVCLKAIKSEQEEEKGTEGDKFQEQMGKLNTESKEDRCKILCQQLPPLKRSLSEMIEAVDEFLTICSNVKMAICSLGNYISARDSERARDFRKSRNKRDREGQTECLTSRQEKQKCLENLTT